ncbi:MAG: LysR family transcriptional regulator [Bdellovibrionaceae bacterium]|nr:LysR family transcriptional regulator [Pseudobdellovibrionaceae bacterium]NUM57292.1 LysR family transcriptional regulator [Pseudobdellovibrionaceae bacterium]
MDLNEIKLFIKVVQLGSFTQAAKSLGVPNSTVSFKVSQLEQRLGVSLIHRTTRKLNVTPAGESYYKKCLQGYEEILSAEAEIAAMKGEPQGLLRVTAPVDLGGTVLPQITSDYIRKYPKVRIEILLTDRRVDLLSESVDLAIRAGELKDSSMISKKLGATYFVPVATQKYLKKSGTPEHPRDLSKHQCLQFSPIGVESWNFVSPKGSLNVSLPGRIIINHLEMLKKMVLNHDGVAYLPTNVIFEEVKSGELIRLLPEWRSLLSPVHFIYPSQRFVTVKLSSFIDESQGALKEIFKNYQI